MPTNSTEWFQLTVLAIGIPFCIMFMTALALNYFIALKSRPEPRAAWVAGLAYFVTVTLITFGTNDLYPAWAILLACTPSALLVYWFWVKDYRKGWVENEEDAPEGAVLANHDWQAGLLKLLALIFAATVVTLSRRYLRGDL